MFGASFHGITWMMRPFAVLALVTAAACHVNVNVGDSDSAINTLSKSEQNSGWKLLFNGKDLTGWRNYKSQTAGPGWKVIDGVLTRAADSAGDIVTVDKYRNFELALDWRISEGGNSGVLYRGTEDNDYIWQSAPEMQILDNDRHSDGKREETSAGSVFDVYPVAHRFVHPAGQWNSVRIVANGNHIEHWMNGQKVVDYTINSDDWKAKVAASKWKSTPTYGQSPEGYIGLQDHGDKVEFRNIRIRVLP
jgi:hypothetical protein